MQEPNFTSALADMDRNQVVLMGMETHVCILQTAIDLISTGKQVYVVEDAVSSRRDSDKQAALHRLRQAGAIIITSEMAAYEWLHRSGTDTFRHITKTGLGAKLAVKQSTSVNKSLIDSLGDQRILAVARKIRLSNCGLLRSLLLYLVL